MKEGRYGGGEGTVISGDGEGDQVGEPPLWAFEAGLGDHDGEAPPPALLADGLRDPPPELPLALDPEGDWRVDAASADPATKRHPNLESRSNPLLE